MCPALTADNGFVDLRSSAFFHFELELVCSRSNIGVRRLLHFQESPDRHVFSRSSALRNASNVLVREFLLLSPPRGSDSSSSFHSRRTLVEVSTQSVGLSCAVERKLCNRKTTSFPLSSTRSTGICAVIKLSGRTEVVVVEPARRPAGVKGIVNHLI